MYARVTWTSIFWQVIDQSHFLKGELWIENGKVVGSEFYQTKDKYFTFITVRLLAEVDLAP